MDLTTRQDYYDTSIESAKRIGCDLCQLKYDGWWCRLVIQDTGNWVMYSRTGRSLKSGRTSADAAGIYIGEYMFGTQWAQSPERREKLFLFDCWQRDGTDASGFPYRDRFALLRTAKPLLPDWCLLVSNYRMDDVDVVWQTNVVDGDFEGLVFRNSKDTVASKVFRLKKTIQDEYLITGVEVGEGKYANTLGALVCKSPSGETTTVGGGLTDELRNQIWSDPTAYIGKTIEVEGKARFDSGLLRHPQYIRMKDTA